MKANMILNNQRIHNFLNKNILNTYLKSQSNLKNLSFIYDLKNNFKISNKSFFHL